MKKLGNNEQGEIYKERLANRPNIPHIIKYMGSKRELIKYLTTAINEIYDGERICDLFAGTGILSGALGHEAVIHSNDIQEYSAVLAKTYLGDYEWSKYRGLVEKLIQKAQEHVEFVNNTYPDLEFSYNTSLTLNEFNALEQQQQELIYFEFEDIEHHLFIKNYSGTYWSFEQCLWIDAIRVAAEEYSKTPVYYPILSSLMFAMAYERSSARYSALRQSLGEPDPFRLKYRDAIRSLISEIVPKALPFEEATDLIKRKAAEIPENDQSKFTEAVETELISLHEGNIARYWIRPSEFLQWKNVWSRK